MSLPRGGGEPVCASAIPAEPMSSHAIWKSSLTNETVTQTAERNASQNMKCKEEGAVARNAACHSDKARASLRTPSRMAASLNEANPRSNPLGSAADNVQRSRDKVSTPAAEAAFSASLELIPFFK